MYNFIIPCSPSHVIVPKYSLRCVTTLLDELGWPILSKRRKDARLILFYKIINNLAQVPHEHILTKAYEGTRKKNNHKFRHIAVNTSQYSCIGSIAIIFPQNCRSVESAVIR